MKFKELLLSSSLSVEQSTGDMEREITGVVYDSRKVKSGNLFVAMRGNRVDGRTYIEEALKRGAGAVVLHSQSSDGHKSEGFIDRKLPWVRVDDERLALARLADGFYGHPSRKLHMTGITGTNGKTTTAYILKNILEVGGRRAGLLTTVEYVIGGRTMPAVRTTPEAPDLQSMLVQMLEAGCDSAVMEVSSHSLMQKRVEGVEYDIAVFSNLSRDHLDYHETMEKYFQAKKVLFAGLGSSEKSASAVINVDDPYGRRICDVLADNVQSIKYGIDTKADVMASGIKLTHDGTEFCLESPWGRVDVRLNLLGRFNISNALAAMSAAGCAGVSPEVMASAMAGLKKVPGRLETIKSPYGFQVFVDYAHTDDALEKVLTVLREITRNRLIVIFGCGGNRDKTKRPKMGEVAGRLADYTIITSDNPRREDPKVIINEIEAGFSSSSSYEVIKDRREAIRVGLEIAEAGDLVLVAGKGHENYQELENTIIPFDDRQVIREALEG